MKRLLSTVAAATVLLAAGAANATIAISYNNVPTGQTNFDNTVTGAGGVVNTQVLALGDASYTDFSLNKSPNDTYSEITGALAGISPSGTHGNAASTRPSGVTFTFTTPVNAFGLNVGDWGTCCHPSALYIAFDGGAPIQVGLSNNSGDVPLTNGSYSIFVGAIDDTGDFNSVEFWGDGVGEFLVAGGTIRYALLDQGSLPGAVPEPGTWAMMIGGFFGAGAMVRRRKTALATA